VLPVAIVLNLPERICHDRNRDRSDRDFGPHVISAAVPATPSSVRTSSEKGFRHIYEFSSPEEIEEVVI